mmetsp:Transcript_9818/g.25427  ORF Transcript_9818/g.25427 Transcript_9818/m.25427 type:complete len:255 (-) Transcript_9818:1212-1976(-)
MEFSGQPKPSRRQHQSTFFMDHVVASSRPPEQSNAGAGARATAGSPAAAAAGSPDGPWDTGREKGQPRLTSMQHHSFLAKGQSKIQSSKPSWQSKSAPAPSKATPPAPWARSGGQARPECLQHQAFFWGAQTVLQAWRPTEQSKCSSSVSFSSSSSAHPLWNSSQHQRLLVGDHVCVEFAAPASQSWTIDDAIAGHPLPSSLQHAALLSLVHDMGSPDEQPYWVDTCCKALWMRRCRGVSCEPASAGRETREPE